MEELIELNRERYVMKLAWGYSEIGQLYVLLDAKKKISGIATAMQYFGKCIKVLEETENDFIQHNQGNFVIEMLAAISLAIKNNTQEIESIFSITNCIYKFLYKYVWPDIKIGSQFIDIMFSLGCKILNYYESKEDEDMMEFYYPVMGEIGKRLLLDETLTTDERLYIEDYLTKLKK